MRLSTSFLLSEFDCNSGEEVPELYVPNLLRLCNEVLQPLRARWGPLVVVSGWRSKPWNDRVGGAKKSTHLTGQGCDVRPLRISDVPKFHDDVLALYKAGQLPALGGLGEYKNWVHVDTRKVPDGHLRRWAGKGIGSES